MVVKWIFEINFVILIILSLLGTSFAFETFGDFKKECKSICHEAEHIKKSKQDKIFKPECKSCHICPWRDPSQFTSRRNAPSRVAMGEPWNDSHYFHVSSWGFYALDWEHALFMGFWRQHRRHSRQARIHHFLCRLRHCRCTQSSIAGSLINDSDDWSKRRNLRYFGRIHGIFSKKIHQGCNSIGLLLASLEIACICGINLLVCFTFD